LGYLPPVLLQYARWVLSPMLKWPPSTDIRKRRRCAVTRHKANLTPALRTHVSVSPVCFNTSYCQPDDTLTILLATNTANVTVTKPVDFSIPYNFLLLFLYVFSDLSIRGGYFFSVWSTVWPCVLPAVIMSTPH